MRAFLLLLVALPSCRGADRIRPTSSQRPLAAVTQAELLAGASTHVPASFNPHIGAIDTRVNKVMFHPRQCEHSEGGAGIFRCPLAQQLPSYLPGGLTEQVSKVEVVLNGVCFDLYSGQLSGTSFGAQVYPTNFEAGDNFVSEPYVYGPHDENGVSQSGNAASARFELSGIMWFLRVPTHCPAEGYAGSSRPAWNGVLLQYMHHSGGLDTPPFLTYLAHFDDFDLVRRGFAYFSMSASAVAPRDTNPNDDLNLQLSFLSSNLCLPLPLALPFRPTSCDVDGDPATGVTTPGLPYVTRTVVTRQPAGIFADPFVYRDTVRVMKNLLRAVTGRETRRTIALTRSASGGLSMVMAAAQAPRNLFYACGAREVCDDPTSPRVYDAFLNMSASFPLANFMHLDGSLHEPLSLPLVFYDGIQTGNNNPTALIFAREAHLAGIEVGDRIKNYTAIENLPHSPGDESFATRFNGGRFAMTPQGVINPAPTAPGSGVGRQMKWMGQNVFEHAPLAINLPDPDLTIDVARQAAYHTALLYQLLAYLDRGEPMPHSNWDLYHALAASPPSIPDADVVGAAPSLVPGKPDYGSAMDFDGQLTQVQVPPHPDLLVGAGENFTAMMWMRTSQPLLPSPEFRALMGTPSKGAQAIAHWRLFLRNDGRVLGRMQDTEGRRGQRNNATLLGPAVNDGAWHHLALVRKAGVLCNLSVDPDRTKCGQQLYVDGQIVDAQGDTTQNLDAGSPFFIGLQNYHYFDGEVDEVRFFPTAKTASEVLSYAQAPAPPALTDELVYFDFDAANGNLLPNMAASPAVAHALINTSLCSNPFDEDKVCAGAPEIIADVGLRKPWDDVMKFPPGPAACFISTAARRGNACLCFDASTQPCVTTIDRDMSLTTGPFKFHQRRAINYERLYHVLDLQPATIRLPDDQARLGFYLSVGTGQAQRRFAVAELMNGVDSVDWNGAPIHFAGYASYAAYKARLLRAVTAENAAGRYDEEGGAFDVQRTCRPSGGFPFESLPRDVSFVEAGATVAGAVIGKEVAVLAGALVEERAVIGDGSGLAEYSEVHEGATLGACGYIGPGAVVGKNAEVGAGAIVGRDASIGKDARVGDGCTILTTTIVDKETTLGAGCRLGAGSKIGVGSGAGSHFETGVNAVVKKAVTMGDRVALGDDTHVGVASKIGTFVQVGDRTRIGASVAIGSNSQIGRDCVIGDHATIGEDVVIGDGATVAAGTVIPDGSVLN